MSYEAEIRIEKSSRIDYKKALGEIKEHNRSGIKITETKSTVNIKIKTNDITALRATMNAVMRDVQTIGAAGKL